MVHTYTRELNPLQYIQKQLNVVLDTSSIIFKIDYMGSTNNLRT
jgi:hypothetical protein